MPKYRVVDQLHLSAHGPDTMGKGTVFAASRVAGDDLVKRGLVEFVGEDDEAEPAAEPATGKAAVAAPNKAAATPPNKARPAAPAKKASTKGKAKGK